MSDKAFYDDVWVQWRDMQRYAPAPRDLRRMVMKELKSLKFESVLDVGYGEVFAIGVPDTRPTDARHGAGRA